MAEKEYIERERLFNALNAYNTKFNAEINSIILSIPKENVQEVRHGKWIYVDGDLGWADCKCSECGYTDSFEDCTECFYKFCPECGTKMDKE